MLIFLLKSQFGKKIWKEYFIFPPQRKNSHCLKDLDFRLPFKWVLNCKISETTPTGFVSGSPGRVCKNPLCRGDQAGPRKLWRLCENGSGKSDCGNGDGWERKDKERKRMGNRPSGSHVWGISAPPVCFPSARPHTGISVLPSPALSFLCEWQPEWLSDWKLSFLRKHMETGHQTSYTFHGWLVVCSYYSCCLLLIQNSSPNLMVASWGVGIGRKGWSGTLGYTGTHCYI